MKLGNLSRLALVAVLLLVVAPACTKNALTNPPADAAMEASAPADLFPAETVATSDASPQEILDASTVADVVVIPQPEVGGLIDASLERPTDSNTPIDQAADAPFATGEAGETRPFRSETARSEPAPLAPLTVSPTSVNLGNRPIGTAPILTFTVTATSAITDLVVQGVGDSISLEASSTCGAVLAAGASCAVVVKYVVTSGYDQPNYVSLAAGGGTLTAGIFAMGVTSGLTISPSMATFASAPNVPDAPVVFTVTNQSDVAASLGFYIIDGNGVADFKFGNGSCFILSLLRPMGSCTAALVFTPSAAGAATRYANLTVSATGNNADGAIAILIGSVHSPTPLAITPSQSDLGSVQIGTTGPATVGPGSNSGGAISSSRSSNGEDTRDAIR